MNAYQALYKKIKEYNRIIITTHIRPDGDCLGSGFGLKDIIKWSFPEKEVYLLGEEADYLSFLGKTDQIADDKFDGALLIALDTATRDRICDQRYVKAKELFKIDHHINVDPYGDHIWVEEEKCACSQMIAEFFFYHFKKLGISQDGLDALYTGICTDSGRFKYRGVDGDTFRIVGALVDLGANFEMILANLDKKSENLVKFNGYVLSNYQKTENGVAYIKLPNHLFVEYGVSMDEGVSLVNELGVFEDCPVWIFISEYPDKSIRCRLRSKGPDIDKLANKYNGGGHSMAAGANINSFEESDALLKDADEIVKNYKKSFK